MAAVWEVTDTASTADAHIALKRMTERADPTETANATELFEREFHVLSQLTHPRVVAVYDYGRDDEGPYYTMELLDGGDQQALAPVPWRQACALARDVCSVLALLHSRRLVYRDMSPRNVRCTAEGMAKLMDFGAMTSMGITRQLVGTPSFCSPEALEARMLDGRTDLFSFGATLYYALLKQRAYSARDFRQLREAWQVRPVPPSQLVPEIPRALDNLVLELIQLEPAARPASAAEVMERLSAIAKLPNDEQLRVSRAYLATPSLVGREVELRRIRRRLRIRSRGRGHAVLLHGPPGMGRSRLLEAAVLEAKLSGGVVLRAEAGDGEFGPYGAARVMCTQLLDALPEQATLAAEPTRELLELVVPALNPERTPPSVAELTGPEQRPRIQAALRQWLCELSRAQPLTIAVDEVERIDEPSAALLALCCMEIADHALVLICTTATELDAPSAAVALLRDRSRRLELRPLSEPQTRALLASIFGDTPNLPLVAQHLHALAAGNPRDVMRLAQHLVEHDVIRYAAGAWSLPDRVDPGQLPSSMVQERVTRIAALGRNARFLATAMALQPRQPFSHQDCAIVVREAGGERPRMDIEQLVAAQVLKPIGTRYVLAEDGWIAPLLRELDSEHMRCVHLALARLFEHKGLSILAAGHLLHAGEHARGLDVLVAGHRAFLASTTPVPLDLTTLAGNWRSTYELALSLCKRLDRPRLDFHHICSSLASRTSIAGGLNPSVQGYLSEWLQQLAHDAGLDLYAALDPEMPLMAKLGATLQATRARHDQTPEHERGLDPLAALPALAQAEMQLGTAAIAAYDTDFLASRPSLSPFMILSPALVVTEKLLQAMLLSHTGRDEQGLQLYREVLERIAAPDRATFDAGLVRFMRCGMAYAIGLTQATLGLASALEYAAQLESDIIGIHLAPRLRMLHSLWQCDLEAASAHEQRVKLLELQGNPLQGLNHTDVTSRLLANTHCEDLTRIKRSIDELEAFAAIYPGWAAVLGYARAEFARIRGDAAAACRETELVLQQALPGQHRIWPAAAALHVRLLAELDQLDKAEQFAGQALQAATSFSLVASAWPLRMQTAIARARAGQTRAAADADAIIAELEALGVTGLLLGLAHEARARVALHLCDQQGFHQYAAQCARCFHAGVHPALSAKYQRLLLESRYVFKGERPPTAPPLSLLDASSPSNDIESVMSSYLDPTDRAQVALELLMQRSRASEGFLFSIEGGALRPIAKLAQHDLPQNIRQLAHSFVASELVLPVSAAASAVSAQSARDDRTRMMPTGADEGSTALQSAPASPSLGSKWTGHLGRRYRPILLSHSADGDLVVTGIAVLVTGPDRPFVHPDRQLTRELSKLALASKPCALSEVRSPP